MTNEKGIEIDPVLLAVLANRFDGIIREMTNTMLRSARSAVINSARDFSCAICTGDGELFAVAEGLPIHIFGSDVQCRVMKEYHSDLAEGDCYLHNDPYTGNTHPADHTFLVPVFFEGEHLFTAVAKAHQADIGNSIPSTYAAGARDIYEEGALIFPAVRIQRGYEMNADFVRMAQKRIRIPSQWYGDFLAGISSARVAEKRIKELAQKYGAQVLKAFVKEWLAYSERRMIAAIRELPAASTSNEGRHDSVLPVAPDGIPVRVSLTIRPVDAMIDADLTENVDNLPCGLNLSEATSTSGVLAGIFNCLPDDIPRNAGSFRRVNVKLRDGAIIGKPKFPHSCSVATTNLADRLINTTGSAFSKLGEGQGLAEGALGLGIGMAVISGHDHRFDIGYVNQLHIGTNGGPASPSADGWITYGLPVISGLMYRDSVEIDELKHPVVFKRLGLLEGTGGAGKFRGSPGSVVEYGPLESDMTVIFPGDGQEYAPRGVRGGHDGAKAGRWLLKADGSEIKLANACTVLVSKGEFVRGADCSGGGYGNAFERDPARVVEDVAEGYETAERAASIYGVVLSADTDQGFDAEATQKRRSLAS
ncbi:hydantoinase B/oxoprolinase family protein [Agrobacterium arsenijevicii]|uniref:Hydantoinase n=1 Tax=Agrobacterium arsenijevicii TaxID=1585697 RepID=A0ABR5D0M9_9HYPH|nr:hydantoinase [Agrobacterium arsenijevicii]